MIIMTVTFKSNLSHEEILAAMEERLPDYRATPGLVEKYYGHDQKTGAYTGVLVWESQEALLAFKETELAKTVADAYQAAEPLRIEVYDVFRTLRPAAVAGAAS